MRTAKTLIRLGGRYGLSEFSLGAHAILLVCRALAHLKVFLYISQKLRQDSSFKFSLNLFMQTFVLISWGI